MRRRKWALWTVASVLIGATAAFLAHLQSHQRLGPPGLKMIEQSVYDEKGNVIGTTTVDLPLKVLDYRSHSMPITAMELGWLPHDTTYGHRTYEAPDHFAITLHIVLMGTDRGSIHKPQICLVGQGWKIEQSDLLTIPLTRPHPYDLPIMRLTSSKEVQMPDGRNQTYHSLFSYWFVAENHITARHGERMWWMAKELVRSGTLQRWAYVSCQANCLPGQEASAWQRMKEFMAAAVPEFQLTSGPVNARLAQPQAQMAGVSP